MKDEMVYKAAMTCTKEEIAGMYSLALKREQEIQKENAQLREKIKERDQLLKEIVEVVPQSEYNYYFKKIKQGKE
jgi:hypothetical protein